MSFSPADSWPLCILLRRGGKGAITSMMWDDEGRRLVFGSAEGDCGVVDIAG